jgi:hypothetical protein
MFVQVILLAAAAMNDNSCTVMRRMNRSSVRV